MFKKCNFLLNIFALLATTQAVGAMNFCFNATFKGFRVNTAVFKVTVVSKWIECVVECVKEPCCRSLNYKKKMVFENGKHNCEMLHDVVQTEENLEKNSSYEYVFFNEPEKEYNKSCLVKELEEKAKDIDECAQGSHACHVNAACINANGSYLCQCSSGFSGNGKNCTDIDECSQGNHTCHINATCINTNGSYLCQCFSGFSGNGKDCTGPFCHMSPDGFCYKIIEKYSNWSDARDDCQARGGDLAVPTSEERNRIIFEAIKDRNISRAWIGIYRSPDIHDSFYTVAGNNVSYENWDTKEPNDHGRNEDCVEMWRIRDAPPNRGKWNDIDCSNKYCYICEFIFE